MKTKSKKAKAKKTAPKTKQPAVVTPRNSRATQIIKLLRKPKDGELKGQALTILEVLEKKGGTLTVAELIRALEGKIQTKNCLGVVDCYAMNRPRLLEGGYVEVTYGEA
jgi:hypothetical protein